MGAYLLLFCIALPFCAVLSLFFIRETRRALDVALGFSLLTFLSSVGLWMLFTNDLAPAQYQFITEIEWASNWNIHFSIGIDGISLLFIVLTAFLTPACLLASWESIQVQQKEFFMLFMLLEGFLMCVFSVLTCLQQTDLKRVIAYRSVGHMGFVTLGLFTLNQQGIEGAILLMVSHGIIAASLFLLIGFIYDRHHTREIGYYGGVVYTMPLYGSIMFFFMMANISLPGTASFVGEFMVLLGAYSANTTVAVFSTTGVILGCAYSLWLMNRILFGNQKIYPLSMSIDLNRRETFVFIPLILLTLWFGMYPKVLMDVIHVPTTILLYNGL